MSQRGLSTLFGVLLILIGLWMIADRLGLASFEWSQIYPLAILLIGIAFLARLFGDGDRHAVFAGSVLTLIGLFFVLRNYEIIPYLYSDEYWALLLAIVGLGFIFQFLALPDSIGPLVPGGLLLFFGVVFFGQSMGYWYAGEILRYWPAILIFLGITFVVHSLVRKA